MIRKSIIVIAAIILAALFLLLPSLNYKVNEVKIKNNTIKVEVADDHIKRIKGLMLRETLANDSGMLFIFNNEDYHSIWMMNMSFSLDIIWIDRNMEIVDIVKNAQPCKLSCPVYKPQKKAKYVLEMNAGYTDKNKIKIGDTIIFIN